MSDILVLNGEVIWNGEDIYITDASDAVDQEVYLRATCDLGESIFYGDYGSKLFTYLGKSNTASNKSFIETEAKEVLLKTKGIKKVLEVLLKQITIENREYPIIYARYQYENSEKIIENTFKFLI